MKKYFWILPISLFCLSSHCQPVWSQSLNEQLSKPINLNIIKTRNDADLLLKLGGQEYYQQDWQKAINYW
ncbi:MAG TPA: hypothetical protein V6C58_11680 [Allocoleopsis sp.]